MNAKTYLTNVLKDWFKNKNIDHPSEQARYIGAMEAGLLFAGVLRPGMSFEYKTKEVKGWFGRTKTRKETYKEHIVRLVGEFLATPSGWHSADELPPICEHSLEANPKDLGGYSKTLVFRHASGKLSWGRAVLHEGKVAWWYPGHMDDIGHIPQTENCKDPIVSWALAPSVEQIAQLIS